MKIFDSHFHIINPKFPLVKNQGYLPPAFAIDDYKAKTANIDIVGGAVVSGSFQGFDQTYLLDTLPKLGKGFYGVANIPFDITKDELEKLNNAGVTAVRFNLKRGGSENADHLVTLSNRLFDEFGWHAELYVDSKHLPELDPKLNQIPKFSIDHLGLSKAGLNNLYRWVEKGVKIKATGFGRLDFDPLPVLKQIYKINPEALMFGTDLPSTRAQTPFSIIDAKLISEHFSQEEQEKIFYKNAYQWYNNPKNTPN